jgi:hypothetical protein
MLSSPFKPTQLVKRAEEGFITDFLIVIPLCVGQPIWHQCLVGITSHFSEVLWHCEWETQKVGKGGHSGVLFRTLIWVEAVVVSESKASQGWTSVPAQPRPCVLCSDLYRYVLFRGWVQLVLSSREERKVLIMIQMTASWAKPETQLPYFVVSAPGSSDSACELSNFLPGLFT